MRPPWILPMLLWAGCGGPIDADTTGVVPERAALTSQCPTAPDTATSYFAWQTVHGPISAVWTPDGRVARIEHVYEYRQGWGVLIPPATRKNCYRVHVEREDGSDSTLLVESPGQPTAIENFAMLPPGYVVVPDRRADGRELIDVAGAAGVSWSVSRDADACHEPARLIPAPDGESLVRVWVGHGCAGQPLASRLTLSRYTRAGQRVGADQVIDLGGGDPWVAFDRAGNLDVSDGTSAFAWAPDGTLTPIAVPACNRNAPTTSGPVDGQGRVLFWNGGAVTVSPAGTQSPFGC